VDEAKELSQTIYHLYVQNELLHHKNNGLKKALTAHMKHKGKSKTIDLQQRKKFCSSAVMWMLCKFREAHTCEDINQQEAKQLCKRLDLCWPQWVHFGSQEHHRTS
jgi:hypothetical protein